MAEMKWETAWWLMCGEEPSIPGSEERTGWASYGSEDSRILTAVAVDNHCVGYL